MRVPWTVRKSNQSILKEINHEYPLEGLMQKLKLQCFVHLMQRADSLKKILMLGKIDGKRRGQQRMRWLDSITDSVDMNLRKLWGTLGASQVALVVKSLIANAGVERDRFNPWVGKIPWRRAWQLTPVFLPGESHGQRNLVGYSP